MEETKYTETFGKMLDIMDFCLEQTTGEKDKKGYILFDKQRDIYLDDIDDEIFVASKPSDIVERLSTYIEDYYFEDLDTAWDDYSLKEKYDKPQNADEWVIFKQSSNPDIQAFVKDYSHEIDIMEMISNEKIDKLVNLDDIVITAMKTKNNHVAYEENKRKSDIELC